MSTSLRFELTIYKGRKNISENCFLLSHSSISFQQAQTRVQLTLPTAEIHQQVLYLAGFTGGNSAKYTKVYPTYKYMQTYTLTCSSKSLSDSDLKGNPLAYCYTDKVRVTPRTSFCTWQPRRNECQKTSADSSSSSHPHCECLCTGVQVGRHLKLQSDPFTCGPSEYSL